ncbi:MAG: uroporphyrinogen decarboxylase (URO-D) [Lachnospiraceae bacterium]|nr:uroporphyrinogen decarboxylase (URO-D) [Lachnospiraceae bacterium]
MLTPKQNLLECLKFQNGHPECLPNDYTMIRGIPGDPCFKFARGNRVRGTTSLDRWGTTILFPEDAPAAVPFVTPENAPCKDIETWREEVTVPDIAGYCAEASWEESLAAKAEIDQDRYLTCTVMGTGIFEQMHMLMTFDDTLLAPIIDPDNTHDMIEAIKEYRLTYMKLIVENLHPDMIISHDDWGSKNGLFYSPEVWEEFFMEPYRELYHDLHENGVIVMHHGDSYLEPIVEQMADIGIDIWQGVLPTNDIAKISAKVGDRMLLMGGIDSIIDRPDVTEEEIRRETRRACTEYGELPGFWPGITYGGPGTLYPEVLPVIVDEIDRYNMERFGVAIS